MLNFQFILSIAVDEDMVNFTISLLNVYKLSILMPRLQVNRLQMFLDILKQKLLKMVKNKLFIQKRMVMASLMKNHVSQYQINQRIVLRLESFYNIRQYIGLVHQTQMKKVSLNTKNLFSEETQ